MISNRPNIYIAAPLFSPNEREWNVRLRASLSDFSDVYLPQEDGSLLTELLAAGMDLQEAKNIIFAADLKAIDRCDILFLVMDGRVIDEGACFELGYAFNQGKICVGLKTDVRSLLTVGNNPMIDCALREIFADIATARDWIRNRRWDSH